MSKASASVKVLLVEDNPADARLVREFLRDVPSPRFELQTADRLAGALGLLAGADFDVVLLDLSLPDTRGIDTFHRLHGKAGERPIIVLSGLDDEHVALQAVNAGAQDYLVKSRVDGELLVRSILYALERKRAENAQRERDLLRAEHSAATAQLATGVVHELRNPLTSIKMLVQANREDAERAGAPTADLEIIEQEIRRMERFLQNFLDFARPAKLRRSRCRLRTLAEGTLALLTGRARQQAVTLRFVPPPADLECEADAEQIRQLLVNLGLNALDAMPRGGELAVELAGPADGRVEIRMTDTGPGITPAILPKLFQSFVTSKETGMGLGLAISRRIAEDHGGTLTAGNRPGGGACFTLRLPAPNT